MTTDYRPPPMPAPDPPAEHDVTEPSEPFTRHNLTAADQWLTLLHDAYSDLCGYDCEHPWTACHGFALARIRGVAHTTWVLWVRGATAKGDTYMVADMIDSSMGEGHAEFYPPQPSWGRALLHAVSLVTADAEVTETLAMPEVTALRLLDGLRQYHDGSR